MKIRIQAKTSRARRKIKKILKAIPALVHEVPRLVAEDYLEDMAGKAPRDIEGYPEMLGVFRVAGEDAVVVMPDPQSIYGKVGPKNAGMTLLYVVPKRRDGAPVSEAADLLAEHNPWTLSTLPYRPTGKEAEVVSRRVRSIEVAAEDERLKEFVDDVREQLVGMGVTLESIDSLSTKRDVAFEILRAEFGIYRTGRAHWRPAMKRVDRNTQRIMRILWRRVMRGTPLRYNRENAVRLQGIGRRNEFQARILRGAGS